MIALERVLLTGALCLTIPIALPPEASAQAAGDALPAGGGTGLFIGLSAGGAVLDPGQVGLVEVGDPDAAGAAKLRIGYWFSEHWGVEANYAKHGALSQRYENGTYRATGDSAGLALLGRLPINERWDIVGKLNLTHTRLKDDGSTGDTDAYKKLSGSSANLTFPGLEVGYRFGPRARLYLETEYRGWAGDEAGVAYSGLGFEWRF